MICLKQSTVLKICAVVVNFPRCCWQVSWLKITSPVRSCWVWLTYTYLSQLDPCPPLAPFCSVTFQGHGSWCLTWALCPSEWAYKSRKGSPSTLYNLELRLACVWDKSVQILDLKTPCSICNKWVATFYYFLNPSKKCWSIVRTTELNTV